MPRKKKVEEATPTTTTSCEKAPVKEEKTTKCSPYGRKALKESAKFTIK